MKSIWITGASSGIGKALALKFAKEGWQVAASARREDFLNKIAESNENISSFPLDVTDSEKCKEIFEQIKNKLQNIDICFFSTGTWDPKKEKEIDIDQMKKVMNVNFFGTLNCIKAVENYFKEKNGGHISIVSSIAGYRGLPNSTGYGASKAAVHHLTRVLAAKLVKENILVNAIAPGPYPSAMLGSAVNHDYSEIAKRNPRKRVGTPEDMAGLAIFLCSRAGAYTVGETITSDGGIVKTSSHNFG